MTKIEDIVHALPRMLSGNELMKAMLVLPEYDAEICTKPAAERLVALSDLYSIYLPSQMSAEIYSKLYLALLRSLQKKETKIAIQQRYQNHKAIHQQEYSGIIGGSDSFTIIGASGIGKSTAISRTIELISVRGTIEIDEPHSLIIPCVIVQCPFDCSVKGMLLEVLRLVDKHIGTSHYENALRTRATVDMLIGAVSQVALNHIGLLIVDEIQNVVNHRQGRSLIGMLTQLINNSGISICMVGTPESAVFFEQALQLARRSLGLQYDQQVFDQYFHDFCCAIFGYQYTQMHSEITPAIIEWLYEHSAGIISVVVSLIHDAQEIAILNGKEMLNLDTLNEAYQKRLALLHTYIASNDKRKAVRTAQKEKTVAHKQQESLPGEHTSIAQMVIMAKEGNADIVDLMRHYFVVSEVKV